MDRARASIRPTDFGVRSFLGDMRNFLTQKIATTNVQPEIDPAPVQTLRKPSYQENPQIIPRVS